MKISELIEILQKTKEVHGDLDVYSSEGSIYRHQVFHPYDENYNEDKSQPPLGIELI